MKTTFQIIVIILLSVFSIAAQAKLKIVTTTTDYADLAKQIGGDLVEVHSVMKGPENLHNVMASPTEMRYLNDADLFVHSGLDTEPWRDNLVKGARNPNVLADMPGNVDMSVGIELKDVPEGKIDRAMGDVHAYGNGHFTLNPHAAQRMTVTLLKAMVAVDPEHADVYKKNAKALVMDMEHVGNEIRETFEPYKGLKVVTFHKAWDYFFDAVPIVSVGTIEPKPSITPSAKQVAEMIERMKKENVKIVICETYDDDKLAKYIADHAGAKLVILPDHVNGIEGVDTYQKLFRYNVEKLIETAKRAGIEPIRPDATQIIKP